MQRNTCIFSIMTDYGLHTETQANNGMGGAVFAEIGTPASIREAGSDEAAFIRRGPENFTAPAARPSPPDQDNRTGTQRAREGTGNRRGLLFFVADFSPDAGGKACIICPRKYAKHAETPQEAAEGRLSVMRVQGHRPPKKNGSSSR